jgi:Skp family chaperone for outer membrane proteins
MKKILCLAASLLATSTAFLQAKNVELVSIDSIAIMQKSVEGKVLVEKIQKDIEAFQNDIKKTQQELTDSQEALNKQAKVLSKESFAEKSQELLAKRKKLERDFADKEEALREKIKREEVTLRQSQLGSIQELCQKNEWGALIDKNAPGVLFVSNAIDRTEEVLKAVDEKYQAVKKATTNVKTAQNKQKPTIKTA